MAGRLLSKTWQYDPTLDAPVAYRGACRYEAFLPVDLASLDMRLPAALMGLVSEAEQPARGGRVAVRRVMSAYAKRYYSDRQWRRRGGQPF